MSCPICKAAPVAAYRPFCSKRCADLDLGRWMTGAYAIPSEEPLDEDPDVLASQPPQQSRPH